MWKEWKSVRSTFIILFFVLLLWESWPAYLKRKVVVHKYRRAVVRLDGAQPLRDEGLSRPRGTTRRKDQHCQWFEATFGKAPPRRMRNAT